MANLHLLGTGALLVCTVFAQVHPIKIQNKLFVDSVTQEPFYIRGIDYQPGGASDVSKDKDPLSDPDICARDITLFQDLGVNTIRIYSVNPDLNHDVCMSLLATAGIYLVLDVNSPLEGQHLNRYEPWTTYTDGYLEHVFKVVESFSHYNNTLAFFAGNEIINDEKSAQNSPPFVKQLINDMKSYIDKNCPRSIPVGYSAADDLDYRVSLSKYLECDDPQFPNGSVDFYGVNTYQWCGQQTFETSGYSKLVDDYADYSKPVFFSEFGCNEVTPRQFEEIETMHSTKMTETFSGGLVYEYSLEANDYGLVDINANTGDITILPDYLVLQNRYKKLHAANNTKTPNSKVLERRETDKSTSCDNEYENIEISGETPHNLAKKLIKSGVDSIRGSYVQLSDSDMTCKYKIYSTDKKSYDISSKVKEAVKIDTYSQTISPKPTSSGSSSKQRSGAVQNRPSPFAAIAIVFVPFFAILYI